MATYRSTIVLDAAKCTDCKICELTCSAAKELVFNREKARLRVERRDLLNVALHVCRLCDPPGCALACPTQAIEVSDGSERVAIVAEDCNGCRKCIAACPHRAVTMWTGRKLPAVCDFCGGEPECVAACPEKALGFERDGKAG